MAGSAGSNVHAAAAAAAAVAAVFFLASFQEKTQQKRKLDILSHLSHNPGLAS